MLVIVPFLVVHQCHVLKLSVVMYWNYSCVYHQRDEIHNCDTSKFYKQRKESDQVNPK